MRSISSGLRQIAGLQPIELDGNIQVISDFPEHSATQSCMIFDGGGCISANERNKSLQKECGFTTIDRKQHLVSSNLLLSVHRMLLWHFALQITLSESSIPARQSDEVWSADSMKMMVKFSEQVAFSGITPSACFSDVLIPHEWLH